MLWLIPAGTHLRIGTLLNSFSPTSTSDDTPLSDSSESLSDSSSSLSDSSLLDILRKEENAASNYQWSALSRLGRRSRA